MERMRLLLVLSIVWLVPKVVFSQPLPTYVLTEFSNSSVVFAFSPDGTIIAASRGYSVRILEASSGKLIRELKPVSCSGSYTAYSSLKFSPDGEHLAAAMGSCVYIWSTSTWGSETTLMAPSEGPKWPSRERIQCMAFSADGTLLFCGMGFPEHRGTTLAWNIKTNTLVKTYFPGESDRTAGPVTGLDVSPLGDALALTTGGGPGGEGRQGDVPRFHFIDLRSWSTIETEKLEFANQDQKVSFSADGKYFAFEHSRSRISLYETKGVSEINTFKAPSDVWLRLIGFSPNSKVLVYSSYEGKTREAQVTLWDINSEKTVESFSIGRSTGSLGADPHGSLSPDGRHLALWVSGRGLLIYRLDQLQGERVAIVPAPRKPAQLEATVTFSEPSGNNTLDAEETCTLTVLVRNTGGGTANVLDVSLMPMQGTDQLRFQRSYRIAELVPGQQTTLAIPVTASELVATGEARFMITIKEGNGFDLEQPVAVRFPTRAYIPPKLVIADFAINDQDQNGRIEPREMVDVTVRIQNKGEGAAHDVAANVKLGENVFIAEGSKKTFSLGDLEAGHHKDVTFTIYTNSMATGVPVSVGISEAKGRFGCEQTLSLAFNKPQKRATELVVQGKEPASRKIEDVTDLSVDVDVDIPTTLSKGQNKVAIIFGVEHYRSVSTVPYAKRDAAVLREYAVKVLGVPDDKNHLYYRTDDEVTRGEFEKLFAENGWLSKRVDASTEVYIYYAGHGSPDLKDKSPYLIPSDGDPNYPTQTGFSLNRLYVELGKLNAKSVTVFLDACFSGGTRDNKTLLADARVIGIQITNPVYASERLIVFAASSGDQISSGYPEKKHGLFTYFLLKGLRGDADTNRDKSLTVAELEEYIVGKVSKTAGLLDREQTPQVMGKERQKVLVRY